MDTDKGKQPPEKFHSFNTITGNIKNPMDTEEEDIHLPQKSYSFAYRDDGEHHHQDLHQPQNQDNVPLSDDIAPPPPVEDEGEAKDENIEESTPSPPDLGKVSQEIDHFISALSNAKAEELEPPEVPEFLEQFALLFEEKISNYDSSESSVKWSLVAMEDVSSFLESVDRISKLTMSLSEFSSEFKYASSINRIGTIQQRTMSYLEDEFRSLLADCKGPDLDHKQSSSSNQETNHSTLPESNSAGESNFPGYSDEVVSNLNRIAKAMLSGGYGTECCQVYTVVRRKLFEDSLRKVGFEKVSIDDVQKMNWESLETEIVSWIKTFKECTAVYLPGERKFTESVFSDDASISESLFANLSRSMTIQLLNFVEAVAMTKRSAERLFKFLDTYETLRDLIPAMDGLFPEGNCVDEIRAEASLTRCRLGEAMVSIFCELENSIKADTGKTPVPGGAVHPLTRYTMNYLKYACEYKDTLEQVFKEHQMIEQADSATGSDFDYTAQDDQNYDENNNNQTAKLSPFAMQVMKVMDLLNANLEVKSKLYKDVSLCSIFMMNNGRYISQKVRSATEIKELMDEAWCRKQSSDLRQYHKNYQRETWVRLLKCLSQEGLNVNGKVVKPVLKERFKSFNTMFEEIHKTQSTWVVSDEQLQSELRVSISAVVIPAYRSFMARYGHVLTAGRQAEKYIKYQPEDIETYIEDLFDGSAATHMGRRRP